MAIGEDKAIAVGPVGGGGGEGHVLGPEEVGHGGAAHGGAGVARVRSLDHVGAVGVRWG